MSCLKKELDTLNAVRIKTEPGRRTHASASCGKGKRFRALKRENLESKDGEVFNEEKKPKTRNRKADSSPECYKDVKIRRHVCSINEVFRKKTRKSVLRRLKKLKKGSWDYDASDPKMKILFHESEPRKSHPFDNIIKSTKRNQTLKLPLPPNKSKPGSEIVELPCTSKDYAWKNDVDNPSIAVIDCSIRQVVNSVLVDQDVNKKLLKDILNDLNEAVKFKGFINNWNWFGSCLNGLVCFDSNINLHFECVPENEDCDSMPENMLEKVAVFL